MASSNDADSAVVLSGKGGCGKSLWQTTLAGESSLLQLHTLVVDTDPERNMSNRFGVAQHATGLGSVLEDAGVNSGDADAEKGAKRVLAEIRETNWDGVDLLPAGASLTGASQIAIPDVWLLRDILTAADVYRAYDLILFDTGGRTGSLTTIAMYAADSAYAPISPTLDAVRKATEARTRVERIQRAHPLRWTGVVLSGIDSRYAVEVAIREQAYSVFGDEVRADVPRRGAINEAYQLGERLGDRADVRSRSLAAMFAGFLRRDILRQKDIPGIPDEGVIR